MAEVLAKFISADGHVIEPPNLFVERMDHRFRDRAPHFEAREDADYLLIDGIPPSGDTDFLGAFASQKKRGETLDRKHRRFSDVPPGAFDPNSRIADQELDNLQAEVLYPGCGLMLFMAPDPEYKRECFRVYNDWLAEYCSAQPKRLRGAGLVPVGGPIQWAIDEIHRIAKYGMAGAVVPMLPKLPYQDPYYRPLFEVLQDLNLPLTFHVGAHDSPYTMITETVKDKTHNLSLYAYWVDIKFGDAAVNLTQFVGAGILQDFPRLKVVAVEHGIGWLAGVIRLTDHLWEDHNSWLEPKLAEPPSFYFRRQVYYTFEDDRPGLLTRHLLGVDRLMWGSDYPHPEGTFPRSRERIAKDFADIPMEETAMIVGGNAARLYGIDAT